MRKLWRPRDRKRLRLFSSWQATKETQKLSTRPLLLLGRTYRRGLRLAGQLPWRWLYVRNLFWYSKFRKQNQVGVCQLNMCHTLPRIGYKVPYNKRVNKGDSHRCQHYSTKTYFFQSLMKYAKRFHILMKRNRLRSQTTDFRSYVNDTWWNPSSIYC